MTYALDDGAHREGLYSLAELMRVEPLRIEGAPRREFSEDGDV